jgi:hypothetical protein
MDADEGQAEAQAGDHQPPAAFSSVHGVLLRLAPALTHRLLIGRRQAMEERQVVIQRQTLGAGPRVEHVQIVGHPAEQLVDQRCAAVGQPFHRIALLLQRLEDI